MVRSFDSDLLAAELTKVTFIKIILYLCSIYNKLYYKNEPNIFMKGNMKKFFVYILIFCLIFICACTKKDSTIEIIPTQEQIVEVTEIPQMGE